MKKLPTTSEGLEPVTVIDEYIRGELKSIGIELIDLPKEAEQLTASEILKVIRDIEEIIADLIADFNWIKQILVGLGIIKPLSKEEKIDIIKSYALNKK